MLLGWLPFKKIKIPVQENPLNQPNDLVDTNLNLLGRKELFHKEKEIRNQFIRFFQLSIVTTTAILFVVLVTNFYFTIKLEHASKEAEDFASQLDTYSKDINQSRIISQKLSIYREMLNNRRTLTEPVTTVVGIVKDSMLLTVFSGNNNGFKIEATGDDAASIVHTIYALLKSGKVAQLTLESAEINTYDGKYLIVMSGLY
jgi:hypothetical protein